MNSDKLDLPKVGDNIESSTQTIAYGRPPTNNEIARVWAGLM